MLLAAGRVSSNAHVPLRGLLAFLPKVRIAKYSSSPNSAGPEGLQRFKSNIWKQQRLPENRLVAETPVAEKLVAACLPRTRKVEEKKRAIEAPKLPPHTDRSRINVVGDGLCDDIFKYYGQTLRDRHQGCDIIDLFPGVGVWSAKLNEFLQPRTHLLLEPDAKFYRPFLDPLLQRPNTHLIDKSGIEWANLEDILNPETLPHQVVQSAEYPPKRNDTLLVTANLCWHPPKKFHDYVSISQLVLFQFLRSVQRSSLYQKYGLVRMLIWVVDDEKQLLIPRYISARRRMAFEADMSAEWVTEVAGIDTEPHPAFMRDTNIDMNSAQNVIERMRERGFVIPPGRESSLYQKACSADKVVAGRQPPVVSNDAGERLEALEAEIATMDKPSSDYRTKRTMLLSYNKRKERRLREIKEFLDEAADISQQIKNAKDPESLAAAQKRAAKWDNEFASMDSQFKKTWLPARDNLRSFQQSPPLLAWDRRPIEPLVVRPVEFMPNIPCTLIDIQPRVPNQHIWGPGTNPKKRMPDVFDILESSLLSRGAETTPEVLLRLHPGADQDILPATPSLRDPDQGGCPMDSRWAQPGSRCLNVRQMDEILDAWEASPFSPDFFELVKHSPSGKDDAASTLDDASKPGGGGGGMTGNMMSKLGVHHLY